MEIMMSKKMILKLLLTLPCLSLLSPTVSLADMILDNAVIHFESGKPNRQDVVVKNTSNKPLYIKVTPYSIINPGTDQQSREKVINPKEAGLLVSPNKLVVPPKGRKLIRFLNLNPKRDQEGVYRVAVEPVAGKLVAKKTGLKILIGYEVLVLAQPVNPEPKLVAKREGRNLNLSNEGSTNIHLLGGKQCPQKSASTEDCESLRSGRLYPGNKWTVLLPHDESVQYQLAIGTQNSSQLIP
jgi:P pilus assembly chaperone PapD